jgi:hypothetical protein
MSRKILAQGGPLSGQFEKRFARLACRLARLGLQPATKWLRSLSIQAGGVIPPLSTA